MVEKNYALPFNIYNFHSEPNVVHVGEECKQVTIYTEHIDSHIESIMVRYTHICFSPQITNANVKSVGLKILVNEESLPKSVENLLVYGSYLPDISKLPNDSIRIFSPISRKVKPSYPIYLFSDKPIRSLDLFYYRVFCSIGEEFQGEICGEKIWAIKVTPDPKKLNWV